MPGRAFTFRIDSAPYAELGHLANSDPLTRPLRLIKLHSSLDWRQSKTTGKVEVAPPGVSYWNNDAYWHDYVPGIIFGAAALNGQYRQAVSSRATIGAAQSRSLSAAAIHSLVFQPM